MAGGPCTSAVSLASWPEIGGSCSPISPVTEQASFTLTCFGALRPSPPPALREGRDTPDRRPGQENHPFNPGSRVGGKTRRARAEARNGGWEGDQELGIQGTGRLLGPSFHMPRRARSRMVLCWRRIVALPPCEPASCCQPQKLVGISILSSRISVPLSGTTTTGPGYR